MTKSGTFKFFNRSKGFGFITPDEGGKDVFVHISAVERSGAPMLDGGMRVSFETEADPRGSGPKATSLQMLEAGICGSGPEVRDFRPNHMKIMQKSHVMSSGAAVFLIIVGCAAGPASAASCKSLKGEMVGFGEASTRKYAEDKLNKAIAGWEERTGKKAKPRDKTVDCKVYIEFLGEYECKAEAVVCS